MNSLLRFRYVLGLLVCAGAVGLLWAVPDSCFLDTATPVSTQPAVPDGTPPGAPISTRPVAPAANNPLAVLHTTAGDLSLRLRADAAPLTVAVFKENARRGVYDGIAFLEADPKFVYAGAYLADGSLNMTPVTPPPILREARNGLRHERGYVGLRALRGPNGLHDSHEFYVCIHDFPTWDGLYTIFAHLEDGMSVFDAIHASQDKNEKPTYVVTIQSVEIR
jgi:cyclophilin family peptidyl-prolyl cis-trans isomerase